MNTKRFLPLRKQIDGSSNATIQIKCRETGEVMAWNDAVKAGWFADTKGIPFAAYYSPAAMQKLAELGLDK